MELISTRKSAVELRRETPQEVVRQLTPAERLIFKASIGEPFENMKPVEMLAEAKATFEGIMRNIGCNVPGDWAEVVVHLVKVLRIYYPTFTFGDIRKAFELMEVGELDDLLPRDNNGNPDRKHYQQFNADYMCRILNAYRKERNRVMAKARKAMPKKVEKTEEHERYIKEFSGIAAKAFAVYKETGILDCGTGIGETIVYRSLARVGLVPEKEITGEEQAEIIGSVLERRESRDAEERRELIKKGFDRIISEGMEFSEITIL